jgi:hypothetical protein
MVNGLMELIAPAAEQAVPILHAHRGVTQVVIFDRRDTDDLVRFFERFPENGPRAQGLLFSRIGFAGAYFHGGIVGHGVNHDRRPFGFGGGFDGALGETGFRVLDGIIGHDDPRGAGLFAQTNHRADDIGIGRGSERRPAIEADVGFDHHHVAFGYETFDA